MTMRAKGIGFYLVAFCFVCAGAVCASGVSKWVDKDGKVHYGEQPPLNVQSENLDSSISVVKSSAGEVGYRGNVVLYSTSWCGYCKKARAFLRKNNISFREVDIERSNSGNQRYAALGGRGVPFLVVGDKTVQGFSEKRYQGIFDL